MHLLYYSESRFTAGHYQSIRKATLEQQPSEDTLELSFDLSIPSVPKKIVEEMAKDSQPLDFDCNEFSELLDNTISTNIPPPMTQNEINDNDKTLDSTLPWFDLSSLDTSTQKSQKKVATKKKLEVAFDPASIDTSNIVQAK